MDACAASARVPAYVRRVPGRQPGVMGTSSTCSYALPTRGTVRGSEAFTPAIRRTRTRFTPPLQSHRQLPMSATPMSAPAKHEHACMLGLQGREPRPEPYQPQHAYIWTAWQRARYPIMACACAGTFPLRLQDPQECFTLASSSLAWPVRQCGAPEDLLQGQRQVRFSRCCRRRCGRPC